MTGAGVNPTMLRSFLGLPNDASDDDVLAMLATHAGARAALRALCGVADDAAVFAAVAALRGAATVLDTRTASRNPLEAVAQQITAGWRALCHRLALTDGDENDDDRDAN